MWFKMSWPHTQLLEIMSEQTPWSAETKLFLEVSQSQ